MGDAEFHSPTAGPSMPQLMQANASSQNAKKALQRSQMKVLPRRTAQIKPRQQVLTASYPRPAPVRTCVILYGYGFVMMCRSALYSLLSAKRTLRQWSLWKGRLYSSKQEGRIPAAIAVLHQEDRGKSCHFWGTTHSCRFFLS